MIGSWWLELNHKFPGVETDACVVMPNHFHGIIVIVEAAAGAGAQPGPDPTNPEQAAPAGAPQPRAPLSEVMQWFRTMTTNGTIRGVKTWAWPPFDRKLWQRDYFEHSIRNEAELDRTRQYIDDNPLHWDQDDENPVVAASSRPPSES
jgi:putative transposase